ncbi:hypothetical protein V8C40DRAFT_273856 [Trichoderma camerunense]
MFYRWADCMGHAEGRVPLICITAPVAGRSDLSLSQCRQSIKCVYARLSGCDEAEEGVHLQRKNAATLSDNSSHAGEGEETANSSRRKLTGTRFISQVHQQTDVVLPCGELCNVKLGRESTGCMVTRLRISSIKIPISLSTIPLVPPSPA